MRKKTSPPLKFLSGWKEIAAYLEKGIRTVQRYERELGLPVRRPAGKSAGSVIATGVELDAWVMASPLREAFQLPQSSVDNVAPLAGIRANLQEMHRLREETEELRAALRASLELLQKNLTLALPQHDESRGSSSEPRRLADVLAFDPKKKVM